MSKETTVTTEELSEQDTVSEVLPSPAADAEVSTPATEEDAGADNVVKKRPKKTVSLSRGQELTGKVKTITDFGAFIDINLSQDGLVHISELSRDRVEKVGDVISVGDEVTVWVKNLDRERNRISLTMLKPVERTYDQVSVDDVYAGTVTRVEPYGVFVEIGMEREGLIHVSELSHDFVRVPEDVVAVGDEIQVKVIRINRRKKQVNLSLKALQDSPEAELEEELDEEVYEEDESPMATTMSIAFNKFNTTARKKSKKSKDRAHKADPTMDDLVSRTLKTQEN